MLFKNYSKQVGRNNENIRHNQNALAVLLAVALWTMVLPAKPALATPEEFSPSFLAISNDSVLYGFGLNKYQEVYMDELYKRTFEQTKIMSDVREAFPLS